MKIKYLSIYILIFLSVSALNKLDAQIKRSTKCSAGASMVAPNFTIRNTIGQVVCGTVSNANLKLRQGFQQPGSSSNNGGGFGPLCAEALPNIVTFDAVPKTTACGTYYTFEYTGNETSGLKYEWNFGSGSIQTGSTSKAPTNISYASLGTKTVKLKVSAACGDTTAFKEVSKIINVSGLGFAGKSTIKEINCYGDKNGSIDMTVIGGTSPFTYRWDNSSTSKSQTNLSAGKYSYTITDSKSCTFTDIIQVKGPDTALYMLPAVIPEACEGEKDGGIILNVKGGTAPYIYTWGNKVAGNVGEVSGLVAGSYVVTVVDAKGCKFSNSDIKVREFCKDGGGGIPNVFTPNDNDGSNSSWVIPGIDKYPNNEVIIYNRWGQIIYSKKGYNNEWRGTNTNNEVLDMAAYFYLVKLNDASETMFSGSITLVR